MKIKILNKIKLYLNERKETNFITSENKKIDEKNKTINFLYSYLTESYVRNYNIQLIGDSAGWLGGDWTSFDIKVRRLSSKSNLFTKEEYLIIYKDLLSFKEIDLLYNNGGIKKEEMLKMYKNLIENKKIEKSEYKSKVKK